MQRSLLPLYFAFYFSKHFNMSASLSRLLALTFLLTSPLVLPACGEESPDASEDTAINNSMQTYEGDGFSIDHPENWQVKDMDEADKPIIAVLTPTDSSAEMIGISLLHYAEENTLAAFEILAAENTSLAQITDPFERMALGAVGLDYLIIPEMGLTIYTNLAAETVQLSDGTEAFMQTYMLSRTDGSEGKWMQTTYYIEDTLNSGVYSLSFLTDQATYEEVQEEVETIMKSFTVLGE